MKKTLFYSCLLTLLVNIWQLASQPRSLSDNWFGTIPAPAADVALADTKTTAPSAATTATVPTVPSVADPTPSPAATPSDPVTVASARLQAAGLSSTYAGLYLAAQARTGTPWQLIAAVHRVESHQSGDTARASYAGAVGPFQFMPATWRTYGLDGNSDGAATITSVDDAAMGAGHYLASSGASRGQYRQALYAYNHSNAYVNQVMGFAIKLGL